jgi:hypothetical protein
VGDWTGDGKAKLGVFRAAPDGVTGEFIEDTNNDKLIDTGDTTFNFGLATDHVVIGDWTGDGKAKVGVFRSAAAFGAPTAAIFSLDTNNNHTYDSGDQVFIFGLISDGVVIGDWNGNGISKVGVYRDGSAGFNAPGVALFSLDTNGDRLFDAGDSVFLLGLSTDQFVGADWRVTPPLLPSLQAADGVGPGGVDALTPDQLAPLVNQAISFWTAQGADPAQLSAVRVQLASLPGAQLGDAGPGTITLSSDAAGWGWYVDPTPAQNEEFGVAGPDGLHAQPGSPASGKMDLLTAVEHEFGHELGRPDLDPATNPGAVMDGTLPLGVRRVGS